MWYPSQTVGELFCSSLSPLTYIPSLQFDAIFWIFEELQISISSKICILFCYNHNHLVSNAWALDLSLSLPPLATSPFLTLFASSIKHNSILLSWIQCWWKHEHVGLQLKDVNPTWDVTSFSMRHLPFSCSKVMDSIPYTIYWWVVFA